MKQISHLDCYITLQSGRRAATTGDASVNPYPTWTFMPIACKDITLARSISIASTWQNISKRRSPKPHRICPHA